MLLSIHALNCDFAAAPTFCETTAPFLNKSNVGIPLTLNLAGVSGLSSIFSLQILIFPSYSLANSSIIGEIDLQGPHHSAQKSTITGTEHFKTSVSKLSSDMFVTNCVININKGNFRLINQRKHSCNKIRYVLNRYCYKLFY